MSSDREQDANHEFDEEERNPNQFLQTLIAALAAIWRGVLWIPRKARIVITIFGITMLVISMLVAMRPEAQKRQIPETIVKVEVVEAAHSDYPIVVNTSGTIQADTRGNLVSQIRGEIVRVSDSFKTGGAFNSNEVLIEVDQRDYLAAQSQAAATVSQAQAAYRQEQANAKQAIRDWQRLGNSGTPPELVARQPQLEAARAQLDSATANFETAKLNLERTKIKAPYQGRVIRRDAVLGQYVGVGTVLAEIFSTDQVEVRLPLSQDEFSQLGLDGFIGRETDRHFDVLISTEVGGRRYTWDAIITRTDSIYDLSTRQIDVIASVIAPFSTDNNKPPLKIGQFVNARIQGRVVENAMVIPNKALREGRYVFIASDLTLERRAVRVTWQDDENALIESGINAGDLVVTTSLNSTLAGAKVKLSAVPSRPNAELSEPATQLSNTDEADSSQNAVSTPDNEQASTNPLPASPAIEEPSAVVSESQVEQASEQESSSAPAVEPATAPATSSTLENAAKTNSTPGDVEAIDAVTIDTGAIGQETSKEPEPMTATTPPEETALPSGGENASVDN